MLPSEYASLHRLLPIIITLISQQYSATAMHPYVFKYLQLQLFKHHSTMVAIVKW